MELHRFDTGAALLERAGEFLRQKETLHSLILMLASRAPVAGAMTPYFATVEDDRGVVVAVVRTPPHNVVLSALRDGASQDALDLVVNDLVKRGDTMNGASGCAETVLGFAPRWAAAVGVHARPLIRLAAFEVDRVIAPTWPPGALRRATAADVDRIVEWSTAFIDETGLPDEDRPMATREAIAPRVERGVLHVWEVDGRPVTMAAASTIAVPRIGGVYTPPDLRRRGYASAIVAKLSQRFLEGGAQKVTLSADVANPTSNKIYTALGYRRVGDELMMAFDREAT